MNIERTLHAMTQLGTDWVLWLLALLSIAGLAVVLERSIVLLLTREDHSKLQKQLRHLLDSGSPDDARRRLEQSRSFEARVAAAGLLAAGAGSAEERMLGESQLARLEMERSLVYLGTLGNNAPFVGLLGTVIGIIGAFQQLEGGIGQVSSGLMAEIGEALVATAAGLLVALPSVAFHNLFLRVIHNRVGRAEALGRDVLAYFKAQSELLQTSVQPRAAE